MAAGLEAGELAPGRGDPGVARGIGKGDHPVGVADIEGIADQRHAEGLVQPVEEGLARLGDAVAVAVAQQGDPVRALAEGGRAPHRADHGIVEQRTDAARPSSAPRR